MGQKNFLDLFFARRHPKGNHLKRIDQKSQLDLTTRSWSKTHSVGTELQEEHFFKMKIVMHLWFDAKMKIKAI